MRQIFLLTMAVLLVFLCGPSREAAAVRVRAATRRAPTTTWHGGYYDAAWGMPVGVVVPPKPRTQTNWGAGVGGTTVTPIVPRFSPGDPGLSIYRRSDFQPTPPWPSNTNQFGDYYIRAPR